MKGRKEELPNKNSYIRTECDDNDDDEMGWEEKRREMKERC